MNLVDLLGQVPYLLKACACLDYKKVTIRALRLVNKEASRLALQSFTFFDLRLGQSERNTMVTGASLLQQASLRTLHLHIRLPEHKNTAVLLETFVRVAGPSLGSVKSMHMCIDGPDGRAAPPGVIQDAMGLLAEACPAVTILLLAGTFSPAFLGRLGRALPLLSSLILCIRQADCTYLRQLLRLQPSLIPQLSSLRFSCFAVDARYPDMLASTSILQLELTSFTFQCETQWRYLPPRLKQLTCDSIVVGPPPVFPGDRPLLGSLLGLCMNGWEGNKIPLSALAQVLRVAPGLQTLQQDSNMEDKDRVFYVLCPLTSCTPADLSLLREKTEAGVVKSPVHWLDCSLGEASDPPQPPFDRGYIEAMEPYLTEITRCAIASCQPGELCHLLNLLPAVEHLTLYGLDGLDGVELQDVAVCRQLTGLDLTHCDRVSPMGLYALCLCLPCLSEVRCRKCVQLKEPALWECEQLLHRDVSFTRVFLKNMHVYDTESDSGGD